MADVTPVTTTLNDSGTALVDSFRIAYDQVIHYAPKVLVMVAVVVAGYILARLVAKIFHKLSQKLGLQLAAERSGLADSMRHMGIERSVPAIVGTIVFWLLMCVFVMAAFNILGLPEVSKAMGHVVDYIPNLLVATVVVVVGLLVASFLRGLIATSADRLGISYAEHLANSCYYVLALLTFSLAFTQLGLAFHLLDNLIMIACGGLALGFGLALGLGGRDVMAGILAGYYIRQRVAAGDHVEVAGLEGTVREVGPVATVIETAETGLLNRHTVPNVKMLNEAVR
ncbi:MAG: mechanosensitive ion channel domain-containing protein [Thermoguttaceae bacterium]|jgi:small-conductance mechanosensitive channel